MSVSAHIVKFFMRTIYIPLNFLLMTFCVLAFLSPRIPPFVGYFLCRTSLDWWSNEDICGLNDDGPFRIIRGNVLFNVFRMIGGCASIAVFRSSAYNVIHIAFFEIFPIIVFQNDRLADIHRAVTNCTFSKHAPLMHKYRQLQILNIMFNQIYQMECFAVGMSTFAVLLITSGYFAITMPHLPPLFFSLGVYTTLMEYVFGIALYCMASKVWSNSHEFVCGWKRNDRLSAKALTRRYGKSMQALKVKIGSTNFVEQNIPFLFISFCVQQTISLMLLKKM
jgi:hypothetical protein